MRLFEIDPDTSTVALNKPWIMLIPEFAELFKRDKGSDGDYRGDKKLRTRKELTFIYFYKDFASPITDWEDDEKWKESMYYASLKPEDIDEKVIKAYQKYDELQAKGARSLRTYKALLKTQNAMDDYFENLDMTLKDKKGELLNDPVRVGNAVAGLGKMYDQIDAFRKRVEIELKDQSTGIRGTAVLGDMEGKERTFSEMDVIQGSKHAAEGSKESGGTFESALKILQQTTRELKVTQADVDAVPDQEEGKT